MLWEILGLGAGSLPLTLRFKPMIGGVLYWLRPGTTRLPPWPDKVPLTRGNDADARSTSALYAGGPRLAASTCCSPTALPTPTTLAGRLDPAAVGVAAGAARRCSACATRCRSSPSRAEIYGNLMIIFLFPLTNMIVAAQLVFVCIWWGAASSKLNRHFPFVVTVMISNTPWNRFKAMKRRLYREPPRGPAALRRPARSPPTWGP